MQESVTVVAGDGGNGEGTDATAERDATADQVEAATPPEHEDHEDEVDRGGGRARKAARTALEWLLVVGGALLVALVVKTFLVQAFWIPSPSMRDSLVEGDRVLVNKLADDISDIDRGDIIVFKRPENGNEGHPEGEIQDLIKRVVGLPGDEVEARDGVVYVNDQRLDEPYVSSSPTQSLDRQVVPEGNVFVMGDNRTNSHDSRYFGPVPEDNIVGRAFLRVWPISSFGRL